jgi:hypothetical protein
MQLSDPSQRLLRELLYSFLFATDPIEGARHVMDRVVVHPSADVDPAIYRAAIDEALASDTRLSELMPMRHSEVTVRAFLDELGRLVDVHLGGSRRLP